MKLPGAVSRFQFAVRCCALPAAMLAFWIGMCLHDHVLPRTDPLVIIEKSQPAPDRWCISAKTAPNRNGGTLTIIKPYPQWFYDLAEVDDTLEPGLGHYRLVRDGRVQAIYVPGQLWAEGYVLLLWCIPLLIWLSRPRWLGSWWCVSAAAAVEAWCCSFLVR